MAKLIKEPKHAGGRPSKYDKKFNEQVFKLCLLGATDKEIADFFNVTETTINRWKESEPEFCESLKSGKVDADATIAHSLYNRAKGYSHPDVSINVVAGEIIQTQLTKHYPPDTGAAFIWLKNRRGSSWRDQQEVKHIEQDDEDINELKEKIQKLNKELGL